MSNESYLRLIYQDMSFAQAAQIEALGLKYKIITFLSDQGHISPKVLTEVAQSFEMSSDILEFDNLESLAEFALAVCRSLRLRSVRIVSVKDYNLSLESINSIEDYIHLFDKAGTLIEAPEIPPKVPFLSKFFVKD